MPGLARTNPPVGKEGKTMTITAQEQAEFDRLAKLAIDGAVRVTKTEATLVVIRLLDMMAACARGQADQNLDARSIEWLKTIVAKDLELALEGGK